MDIRCPNYNTDSSLLPAMLHRFSAAESSVVEAGRPANSASSRAKQVQSGRGSMLQQRTSNRRQLRRHTEAADSPCVRCQSQGRWKEPLTNLRRSFTAGRATLRRCSTFTRGDWRRVGEAERGSGRRRRRRDASRRIRTSPTICQYHSAATS